LFVLLPNRILAGYIDRSHLEGEKARQETDTCGAKTRPYGHKSGSHQLDVVWAEWKMMSKRRSGIGEAPQDMMVFQPTVYNDPMKRLKFIRYDIVFR